MGPDLSQVVIGGGYDVVTCGAWGEEGARMGKEGGGRKEGGRDRGRGRENNY